MKMADTQLEFMKVCTAALKTQNVTDVSECEAIGITVTKKLGRMEPIQMVYAESIINTVLRRGLLNTLTDDTNVCDNKCFSHSLSIPSTHNAKPSLTSNQYQYVTRTHPLEYTATLSRPTPQYYTEEMSSHGPSSTPDSFTEEISSHGLPSISDSCTEEMSSHGPPSISDSCTNDSSFIENSNQLTILKTFYENVGSKNPKSHQ